MEIALQEIKSDFFKMGVETDNFSIHGCCWVGDKSECIPLFYITDTDAEERPCEWDAVIFASAVDRLFNVKFFKKW